MNNRLFIDTWGWLTLYDKKESFHKETVNFYQEFTPKKGQIYTTDYVLNETFTLLFKRLNSFQAKTGMNLLLNCFEDYRFNLILINADYS